MNSLKEIRKNLLMFGTEFNSKSWQDLHDDFSFLELNNVSALIQMGQDKNEAIKLFNPLLPWSDIHFEERISGLPLNPPPSHTLWLKGTEDHLDESGIFSHSYPERYWPKGLCTGIRFDIGDFNTLIQVLKQNPTTRQAYLPIYFPEDITAALDGERIPCTLGYHIQIRDNVLNVSYFMRSCDAIRHLHNDLYLTNLLAIHIRNQINTDLDIGKMHFVCSNLHCFTNDKYALQMLLRERR